jgi:hypothetical protein
MIYTIGGRCSVEALVELILAVRCGELGDLIFTRFKIVDGTLIVAASDGTEVGVHPVAVGSEAPIVVDTATMIKVLGLGDNRDRTLLKLRAAKTGETFKQGLD